MRILNLMLAKGRGGLETMAVRYHQALRLESVTILSLGHLDGELAKALPPEEFKALTTGFNHDPFAALKLRTIAAEFKPDLILCHGNRAINLATNPLSGAAKSCIAVVHNFRFKRDIGKARAALCVSGSVRKALNAAYPHLFIKNMVNFGPLEARLVKPAPEGMPVIGTLGRLHINKGLDVLLEAMAVLKSGGVEVRLKIAGDGPEKAQITALTEALDLTDRVQFCGWVAQTPDYLAKLDLFILPSRVEPFGLVVAEAMAAGVPVISSAIDGPKEILKSLDRAPLGLLCPPEDAEALAAAIRTALSDWPATLKMATLAQTTALETYSLKAASQRLVQLLSAMV